MILYILLFVSVLIDTLKNAYYNYFGKNQCQKMGEATAKQGEILAVKHYVAAGVDSVHEQAERAFFQRGNGDADRKTGLVRGVERSCTALKMYGFVGGKGEGFTQSRTVTLFCSGILHQQNVVTVGNAVEVDEQFLVQSVLFMQFSEKRRPQQTEFFVVEEDKGNLTSGVFVQRMHQFTQRDDAGGVVVCGVAVRAAGEKHEENGSQHKQK